MIFPYAPLPPPLDLGGTKRNLPFLLENLKRHEVSVLSYGTPEEEKIFRESLGSACRRIRFVNRYRPRIINGIERFWLLGTGRSHYRQAYRKNLQRALDEMAREDRFDLIHCCVPMMGYLRFPDGVALVSDTHEVTYDLMERTYRSTRNLFHKLNMFLSYKIGKPEELALCRRFDALIATTDTDHGKFRKELKDMRIVTIYNGVGPSFFEPQKEQPEPFTMVFTGLMTHFPNDHGMHYFLDEIFPIILARHPQARIFVVGKSPSKTLRARASDRVIITGYVPDVRPYMAGAQVYVIPLRIGGGIRGKALEAMAMKLPIVTTPIGVEGIKLVHEDSALFGATSEEFAASVIRLFEDPALRARLSSNAYRTVRELYDWSAKGAELDEVYRTTFETKQRLLHEQPSVRPTEKERV